METVQLRSPLSRLAYAVRDRLNAPLFGVIHTQGACVLDVGGGAFHERLRARGHQWQSYAVIEPANALLPAADPLIHRIVGTAEHLPFADASFDVVLAIQVLEHVFDPQVASKEMYRVLRPGGELIILAPQSGTLHLVPHHYANQILVAAVLLPVALVLSLADIKEEACNHLFVLRKPDTLA